MLRGVGEVKAAGDDRAAGAAGVDPYYFIVRALVRTVEACWNAGGGQFGNAPMPPFFRLSAVGDSPHVHAPARGADQGGGDSAARKAERLHQHPAPRLVDCMNDQVSGVVPWRKSNVDNPLDGQRLAAPRCGGLEGGGGIGG